MNRVLIANRGEIALRIIRACRDEGIESVAVFSDPDRTSPHVAAADQAMHIGPAPSAESYLNIERLLDAARKSGADAVHPGYGFLAERAEFADDVSAAGLIFIGPSADAIRAMGEKTEARRRMIEAGVPVVPGTAEAAKDAADAAARAAEVGYPVLLKAAAGGGGKGMRTVRSADEVNAAFEQASSEALKAFGDGNVYVEKFVERPRHVEIQVLADNHGTTVHLGERECSLQRRHQKVIEEAPSVAVSPELRERMGQAAVRAAESVEYRGAGTVEFLLDASGDFYFLEMNTRIQVEHPVTELVFGVDLVREQIRIARGEPMQARAGGQPNGHAIECRITSEDPFNGFLPATGRISALRLPTGPGVRWDGGVEVGTEIGLHYDPLLAKLIVWGEDREAAINRMQWAVAELFVGGVPTSQPFHERMLKHPAYLSGDVHVQFLEEHANELMTESMPDRQRAFALVAALAERHRSDASAPVFDGTRSAGWKALARRESLR